MKKIMALLLVTAMLLPAVSITVGAAEATTEIANFDIDSLGLENGADIMGASILDSNNKPTGRFLYNGSDRFLVVSRNNNENVGLTVSEENGFGNQMAKISFGGDVYYQTIFKMLANDVNANRNNDAAITARTYDIAYSFDIKMVDGINIRVSAKGLPSDATSVKYVTAEGKEAYRTDYLSSTIFAIANGTGTSLKTYSYTKDSDSSPADSTYSNKFTRGEIVNFKVIVDYDNGTFDLYVNNHLISPDNGLAGTKYLSDFSLQIEHKSAFGAVETFVDNLSYRILSDNDLNQVYLSDNIENGTLTLKETFTEVGKPVTFTAIPDAGYKLSSITLDGKTIEGLSFTGKGGTYTIESLPCGGELKAVFEEKRKTAFVAELDADNLEVASGDTVVEKSTANKAISLNESATFVSMKTTGNAIITADGEDDLAFKIYAEVGTASTGQINILRNDLNVNRTDKQKELRTNDIAVTFRVKLMNGAAMSLYAKGLPSTATISKNASNYWMQDAESKFIESKLLSVGRVGKTGTVYSYTKNSTENPAKTSVEPLTFREEYVSYKLLFDYDEGTCDIYMNDKLVGENLGLAGVQYLSDFRIYISHQNGYGDDENVEAYVDDVCVYSLAEEDTNIQTSVEKSGKGTVACDKVFIAEGETANYTITPDEGYFVRNVSFNGKAVPAFSSSGTSWKFEDVSSANTLNVEFGKYEEGIPAVMISPLAVRENNTTYLFCKLLSNGAEVESYGILISRTTEIPVITDEETVKLPFFGEMNANGGTKDAKGYFGFALTDSTKGENPDFYARPYAVVNGKYVYGSVSFIEPASLTAIE